MENRTAGLRSRKQLDSRFIESVISVNMYRVCKSSKHHQRDSVQWKSMLIRAVYPK